jgi:tRNA A37 threonylcarbamoyladenosine dehydratase
LARSRLLVGDDSLVRLKHTNVLIVGLGGVGGFAAEFLCRAGVGAMTIVDGDEVDSSNRNRQLLALKSTQGQPKARVLAQRLLDINPALQLTEMQVR